MFTSGVQVRERQRFWAQACHEVRRGSVSLQPIAENLWLQHFPLSVLGTQHGRNVTVIRLSSGKVVVHSMAPFTADDVEEIRALGPTGWLVEAMLLHDTYAKEGRAAFPGVSFLGPPGFESVVGFPVAPLNPGPAEWADELQVFPLEGAPKLEEQLMLHVPSRTLIVADLVFNFDPNEKGWDRFFHRYLAGFKRYPGMSRIFRLFVKDKERFLQSLKPVIAADFDRLVVGHGTLIETGAKQKLVEALRDAGFVLD